MASNDRTSRASCFLLRLTPTPTRPLCASIQWFLKPGWLLNNPASSPPAMESILGHKPVSTPPWPQILWEPYLGPPQRSGSGQRGRVGCRCQAQEETTGSAGSIVARHLSLFSVVVIRAWGAKQVQLYRMTYRTSSRNS